jgi:hypothetical protein
MIRTNFILLDHRSIQSASVPGRSTELAPSPSHRKRVCPSQIGGGHTLASGKGVGGANSDEGRDTMVICILIPSNCISPSYTRKSSGKKFIMRNYIHK